MQQRLLPLSVHAYRKVAREIFVLAHNAVFIVAIWLSFGIPVELRTLWVIPGLILNAYLSFWVSIVLGIASVRYRDIPPIVQSVLGLLFFVTPILWTKDKLGGTSDLVLRFNPFAYLIAVIRDPMLNVSVSTSTWAICLFICGLFTIIGLFAMSATRTRLAYWL